MEHCSHELRIGSPQRNPQILYNTSLNLFFYFWWIIANWFKNLCWDAKSWEQLSLPEGQGTDWLWQLAERSFIFMAQWHRRKSRADWWDRAASPQAGHARSAEPGRGGRLLVLHSQSWKPPPRPHQEGAEWPNVSHPSKVHRGRPQSWPRPQDCRDQWSLNTEMNPELRGGQGSVSH